MQRSFSAHRVATPPLTHINLYQRHFDKMLAMRPSPLSQRGSMSTLRSRLLAWLAPLAFFFLAGCAPAYIKGTELPSTPNNQAVYDVLMEYQEAFQKRKWRSLLRLISPRYHETKGTSDPDDDYGYEYVKKKLMSPSFRALKVYAFYVRIEKITYPTPTEARVTLMTRAVYHYPRGRFNTGWDRDVSRHIMRLELHRGRWMIVRGL